MKRAFVLIIICLVFASCVIPENPVYINIINHTDEEISVSNWFLSIGIGMSQGIQVEKGYWVKATGVRTGHVYGSRSFY